MAVIVLVRVENKKSFPKEYVFLEPMMGAINNKSIYPGILYCFLI